MPDFVSDGQLQRLLACDDATRALARALVHDAHLADDLTQEAYHTYLRTPPESHHGLAGWLKGVVRNLARHSHRERSRRVRREEAAAVPEELPDPEHLVERLELQRHVTGRVLDLPRTLRDTVLLRFYEGLSSAEIARRTGTPASTVRVRLKRALDILRDRLDDDHGGDRRAWFGGMVALGSGSWGTAAAGVGPATTVVIGATAVKGSLKLVAAAALLVLTAWVVLPLWNASSSPETNPETAQSAVAPPGSGHASSPQPSKKAASSRRASAPSGRFAPVSTEVDGPEATATILTARFVDEQGDPIPGVRWQLRSVLGPIPGVTSPASDEDGVVVHEVEDIPAGYRGRKTLRATGAGMQEHVVSQTTITGGRTHDLGEIVLTPGATVSGTLRDGAGTLLEGARVYAYKPDPDVQWKQDPLIHGPWIPYDRRRFPTQTDARGHFELEGLPPGEWHVAATGATTQWVTSGPLTLSAGERYDGLHLTVDSLADENWIDGVVLYPDGVPVVHARVEVRHPGRKGYWPPSNATDDEGRFVLRVDQKENYDIRVRDRDRVFPHVVRSVAPGSRDVLFKLQATDPFQIEVVGVDGQPIEEYLVATYAEGSEKWHDASFERKEGEHPDGIETLQAQIDPFMIYVFARGHFKKRLGPFLAHTVPEYLRISMEELAHVRGVVLANGEPVQGAHVFLGERVPAHKKVTCRGFPLLFQGFSNISSCMQTDAEGRFDVAVDQDGEYFFSVTKKGYAGAPFEPYRLGPRQGQENIVIEIGEGGSVEGKVTIPIDDDPTRYTVRISRGTFDIYTAAVKADYSYRFDDLAPGPYMVQLSDQPAARGNGPSAMNEEELPEGEEAFDWAFDVQHGKTTVFDLDVRRHLARPEQNPLISPTGD